jgi:hypothetical protein
MQCPKRRLENPPIAERCDCGYDFASRTMKVSYLDMDENGLAPAPSEEVRKKGKRDMATGSVMFILGVGVTAVNYGMSIKSGGPFAITSGAIAWGILFFVRGVNRSRTGIDHGFWGKKTSRP